MANIMIIEDYKKLIAADRGNWDLRQQFYNHLYKLESEGSITLEEYIQITEEDVLEFITVDPDHEIAKQTLAATLKKKLNTATSQNEQLDIYRKINKYSPTKSNRDKLIRLLWDASEIHTPEVYREILHLILQEQEIPEYFISIFNSPHSCYNNTVNYENDLRLVEIILNKFVDLNLGNSYKAVLAKIIFNNMDITNIHTLEDYEEVEDKLLKVNRLSPQNSEYQQAYINWLYKKETYVIGELPTNDQQVFLLESIYGKLFNLPSEKQKITDKYEKILLKRLELNERNFRSSSRDHNNIDVYRNLIRCRPDNRGYKRSLAELLFKSGTSEKGDRNFTEAHRIFDELFRMSSNEEIAKVHYYKGLAYLQEQNWSNSYDHFEETYRHKNYLDSKLIFEFYLSFALCCIHSSNKEIKERAHDILSEMQELDSEKQHLKEIEFVRMYINMFSNIKKFNLYNALTKEHQKIVYNDLEKLLDATLEEDSTFVVLDRRNEEISILYGPQGTTTLNYELGQLLSYMMKLKYPTTGKVIMQNIEYQGNSSHREKFQNLNDKIRSVISTHYTGKLANYSPPNGYLWQYPYPAYVVEEE
jgi:hypothetical protein